MKKTAVHRLFFFALAFACLSYACKKEMPVQSEETIDPNLKASNPLANIKVCTERYIDGVTPRAAALKTKKWKPGTKIKVSLNGTPLAIRRKVIQFAKQWEQYANITFNFVTDQEATIRVGFIQGDGSWSYLGTDAKKIPLNENTMNFGWFDATTPDEEFSRTVIHEFGHALGLIHEQQHPLANIPWNKEAVYAYYGGSPYFWSKASIDHNILSNYSPAQTNYSEYDPLSIMHYPVANELTIGDFEVGWNTKLSKVDKEAIAGIYPFPY
ncbi:M12 family metallopeptidase [Pedobacter sp. MW01-1-1]|uniref:M12 family metallopeptidase n=1 Tax=Pedobacter sp. MW01-1-1 TaxID=3383027 RepID=UPI003FF0DEC3